MGIIEMVAVGWAACVDSEWMLMGHWERSIVLGLVHVDR